MASLEQHEQRRADGSRHVAWRVSYVDIATGRRRRRSFADQVEAAAFRARSDALEATWRVGRAAGVGLPEGLHEPDRAVILDHLRWCEHRGLRASTRRQRQHHLSRLAWWLTERPGVRLLDVDGEVLRRWQVAQEGQSVHSRRSQVTHARSFYRWASEVDRADPRLLRHLVLPRVPAQLPRPIAPDDLASALAGAPRRLRPWLLLAAYAGLRACEVAPLRAEHLDLRSKPATLLVVDGKGGSQRVVPLAPALVAALEAEGLPRRGWLFLGQDRQRRETGRPVSPEQVSHLCSRYLSDSGSPSSFHALRHYFATAAYRVSLDLRLVQELLGHASPRTTAGYAALVPGRSVDVVAAVAAPLAPRAGTPGVPASAGAAR